MNWMDSASDESLVLQSKKGDRKAREVLMERYAPLIRRIAGTKFTKRFREDLEQDLWEYFFVLVTQYEPERSKFSTMMGKMLRGKRRSLYKRKQQEWDHEVLDANSIYAEKQQVEDRHEALETEWVHEMIDACHFTNKQKRALWCLMDGEGNARDLQKDLGMSQQAACQLLQRIREKGKEVLGKML